MADKKKAHLTLVRSNTPRIGIRGTFTFGQAMAMVAAGFIVRRQAWDRQDAICLKDDAIRFHLIEAIYQATGEDTKAQDWEFA